MNGCTNMYKICVCVHSCFQFQENLTFKLLNIHGCTPWENGFWNLIQRAVRGNPVVIKCLELALKKDGRTCVHLCQLVWMN